MAPEVLQKKVTLATLPFAASVDLTKPAAQVRDAWTKTVTWLDLVRNQQAGIASLELQLKIDAARYWAALALDRIARWEAGGGTGAETASTISGLPGAIEAYKIELAVAKTLWEKEKGPAAKPTLYQQLTAGRTDTSYLLWGAAGLALYLLWATKGGH